MQNKETPPGVRMEASYLVETAVLVPVFVGFMVVLLFFFPVLCVQQEVQNALLATGRQLAAMECGVAEGKGELLAAEVLFRKILKKDSAANQFVRGKKAGITLLRSDFSGEYISLRADYQIRLPVGCFGKMSIKFTQRLKCRKWTGAGNQFCEEDEQIVFITPSGTVYHTSRVCTYLKLTVSGAAVQTIASLRNANGGKYYPCSKCMKGKTFYKGTVYYTKYGSRYHSERNCKKIERTILAVRLSQVGGKRSCSKCGKG